MQKRSARARIADILLLSLAASRVAGGRANSVGSLLALAWVLTFGVGCARPSQGPGVPTATAASELAQAPTPTLRTLLDERFQRVWPNDPRGSAWFAGGAYTLLARQPGQFVAIRAPIADVPADVTVSATFHKVGGPPGGGYGLIVRNQTIGAGDGVDQTGQFIVAAVGDRGEVGIWQRANSYWIDLLPWTESVLVHPGAAMNELRVEVAGDRLRFDVNGARVDDVEVGFSTGSVGLFVGGDLNQVQIDRLLVEAAPTNVSHDVAAAAPSSPDIPAARTRLTTLAAQAAQDSTVMQDAAWRQGMAATLAVVEQIARGASASSATNATVPDTSRLPTLVGGIADDLASIMDAFASGVDSARNPVNSPRALDQAAAHLDSAVRRANQVLAEVEAARSAAPTASGSR